MAASQLTPHLEQSYFSITETKEEQTNILHVVYQTRPKRRNKEQRKCEKKEEKMEEIRDEESKKERKKGRRRK